MKPKFRRRSQRSLRTILIVWFLLFAIAPLAFLTGFSIIRYERAIDRELSQRLEGNAREVVTMLSEFKTELSQKKDRNTTNPAFIYHLSTNEIGELSDIAKDWIRSDVSTTLTFFSRTGRMLLSESKLATSDIKEFIPPSNSAIFISDENLEKIKKQNEYSFVEITGQRLSLILLSQIKTSKGKTAGFVEQLIELDREFLESIKNRMKVEILLLRKNGNLIVSTQTDFYEYSKNFFEGYIQPESPSFFELNVRSNPHGFIIYPIKWGQTDLFMAIGASKSDAKAVLKGVNYAFFSVVGAVILLLIFTIILISNSILKPLDDLVQATQDLPYSDQLVEIPIKSDTEIGLLTESFNEMSRQIIRVRAELKAKIYELEVINKELKEAQTRLVHSSKMSSLGQLVAGVAHELNNPIGFIFSNMAHLREYSGKLIQLADVVEKNPEKIEQLKKDLDIEYIKSDLPKLITSCEDGARRVRDIVLGLRNFSRLEEAKLKEINFHEAIDNTLSLLAGEIKGRIQVHKYYGDLPLVTCFASQMNQVFMNILSNAVQSIQGPGNIWITTKTVEQQGIEKVYVSIQDSGSGMSNQVIDKIFDPFFSTKGVGQGTGLGLSITYGIIQKHKGEIQVKSQEGIGTEFIITIPIKTEDELKIIPETSDN